MKQLVHVLRFSHNFFCMEYGNTPLLGITKIVDTSDPIKYEEETDNKESVDIFSRIIWILKDLNMWVEYCIGSTGNDKKKNNIYEYMMRFVSNWEKRETEEYPLGWGIFFKI